MLKTVISGKTSLILLCTILLFNGVSCVPKKPEISPQQLIEHNNVTREADALYRRGSYTCLKQAYNLYEEALTFPIFQNQNREKLLKTAILLGIREKELGILEETYLPKASRILASSPSLSDFEAYLNIASKVPRQTAGIVGDLVEDVDRVIVTLDDLENSLQD